ncbi:MAG TPA: hypothetical protein VMD29_12065 [Terracidiphilus sp.]|nr:hypothetical protein [Terracidiphilus sp.]
MFIVSANPQRTRLTRSRVFSVGHVLALAWLLGASIAAQSPGIPIAPGVPAHHPEIIDPTSRFSDSSIEARQAKMLNVERQRVIVADTDRILQLARELNADANADTPTMSQVERMRKADEIEKLAKIVREKMTNAIGMPPPPSPYSVWQQQ